MGLKGEKCSIVVLQVKGSNYTMKGRFSANQGAGDDAIVIFEVTGSGVFGRDTQHNLYRKYEKF